MCYMWLYSLEIFVHIVSLFVPFRFSDLQYRSLITSTIRFCGSQDAILVLNNTKGIPLWNYIKVQEA